MSRGAGWFVASVLAGAVTALAILVVAGPRTTVVQAAGASGQAALPRIAAGPAAQRVSRLPQTRPGQKAIRIQVPAPGIVAGRPAGGPFTVVGPPCGPGMRLTVRGIRNVVLTPKALPAGQVKLRGNVKLPAAGIVREAVRKLAAARAHLPLVAQVRRVALGKKIIARVITAPLAAAGGCRAIHVVAPPAGGR